MVAPPTARPVTVNEPAVFPAATLTDGGSTSTVPAGLEPRFTVTPAGGAGALRVKVPLMVFVSPTVVELSDSVIAGVITLTIAVVGTRPCAAAVIMVEPILPGVT